MTVSYATLAVDTPRTLMAENRDWDYAIEGIIRRACERIMDEADPDLFKEPISGTLGASSRVIDLSSTPYFGEVRELWIAFSGGRRVLTPHAHDYCLALFPDDTVTGRPKHYAEAAREKLELFPFPDQAYAWSALVNLKVAPLTEAHPTNLLTERWPTVLEHAVLHQGALWMKDYPAADRYDAMFKEQLIAASDRVKRRRRDETTTRQRDTTNKAGI